MNWDRVEQVTSLLYVILMLPNIVRMMTGRPPSVRLATAAATVGTVDLTATVAGQHRFEALLSTLCVSFAVIMLMAARERRSHHA